MPPAPASLVPTPQPLMPRSTFNPASASSAFRHQWTHPSDVFSVLLILGGDVVGRALAQLAGGWLTPVTFSFGWVAYAVTALVSAVGENKLMPPTPDCPCIVINGKNGYVRTNQSWIIGRIVRDMDRWAQQPQTKDKVNQIIDEKWDAQKKERDQKPPQKQGPPPDKPPKAGLCVSVYSPSTTKKAGEPTHDKIWMSGLLVALFQLGIAAIPCGIFGDWGILMITAAGILLAFITGSLPQWRKEKWACRSEDVDKTVVLTTGNGSQHAIVIVGNKHGLDLEDLAAGPTNMSSSNATRFWLGVLAILWVLLLITAAGENQNTWFLLAVGGVGIVHNVAVAGWPRDPSAFGVHLEFEEVIGHQKVMKALYEVEEKYPYVGLSMLQTFFPGELREDERKKWDAFRATAKDRKALADGGAANGVGTGATPAKAPQASVVAAGTGTPTPQTTNPALAAAPTTVS